MKKTFVFVCILTLCLLAQQSQDSLRSYQIPENVVVTANRYATSMAGIGSSISVITSRMIEQSASSSLFALLKGQYGMQFYQPGGPGQLATAIMRGGGSGHTLVLLDGVEINMPNDAVNSVDFSVFPLNSVERIEVLRGSQSTLYGSDAVAGVVNVISKEAENPFGAGYSIEAGSYNTFRNTLGLQGRLPELSYTFSLNRFETKGISSAAEKYGNTESDGSKYWVADAGIRYHPFSRMLFSLNARYKDSQADLDQFGGMGGDDPSYKNTAEEMLFHFSTEYRFASLPLTLNAGGSFVRNLRKYSFDQSNNFGGLSHSRYDGYREKYNAMAVYRFGGEDITTLGAELERESALSYYFYFSSFYSSISDLPRKRNNSSAVYLQHQANPFNNFFITAGARLDSYEKFGKVTTYRISPVYFIEPLSLKLKAALGNSFKVPSLFYLYDPSYGNEKLNPEKSMSKEIGFAYENRLFGFEFGSTYFASRSSDLFGFDAATFRTININKTEAAGVETYFQYVPINEVRLSGSHTFMETRNMSDKPLDAGMPLLRWPKQKASLNINFAPSESTNLFIEGLFFGERFDKIFDFVAGEKYVLMKDYFILNAAVTFAFTPSFSLYARIENALNRQYEEIIGYGTPGAAVYAGIRLGYK